MVEPLLVSYAENATEVVQISFNAVAALLIEFAEPTRNKAGGLEGYPRCLSGGDFIAGPSEGIEKIV